MLILNWGQFIRFQLTGLGWKELVVNQLKMSPFRLLLRWSGQSEVTGDVNYRCALFCLNQEQWWQPWIMFTLVSLVKDSWWRLLVGWESPLSTSSPEDTLWAKSQVIFLKPFSCFTTFSQGIHRVKLNREFKFLQPINANKDSWDGGRME